MIIPDQAKGKVVLNIIDLNTGKSLVELKKNIGDLVNNDYTEFKTNLQLTKKKEYSIQLTTSGAESGKEPLDISVDNKKRVVSR